MQTSQAKTFKRGFTLLELMIVMGIAAALVALALPRLSGQNNQMRQAIRKLSSITRELQTTAKLQGAVYRLVIDMDSGIKSEEQKYWVEKATAKTVLTPDEMKAHEIVRQDARQDSSEAQAPPLFAPDDRMVKGKGELPGDLVFEDVELKRSENPINTGKAYIHFFPQGLADEAVIHLRANEKMRWTLSVHPLTGKTDVATEYVTLKELKE
ncbi:MAG: Tfp pilus assembly protein FimT/FimU [Bdellovibrionales bacterium]